MGVFGFCVIFGTVAVLHEAAGQYTAGDKPVWRSKDSVTTEQTPTTSITLQPITLCQSGTRNSTRRTTTSKSKCLEAVLTPKDWDTAHKHCRKSNAFLVGLEEWESLHLPEVWSNVTAWTALRRFNNYQQWLGERPAHSSFIKWEEEEPPAWSKACAALKVGERMFQQLDCSAELPFICVHYAEYEDAPGMINYDDLELRLESDHNATMGWISIKENELKKLNLKCRAYVKSTGAVLDDLPVFWTRDGIFFNHKTHALQPSTVYDSTRVKFIEGEQNTVAVKQGTFWCETWRPGSTEMIQSNKVLVTFSDWETFVIKIYRYERRNSTTKSSLKRLRKALHYDSGFSNVYNIPVDLIQAERVMTPHKSQKILTINTFHLHIQKNRINGILNLEYRRESIASMFNEHNYESGSWLRLVHTCFKEEQDLPFGNTLAWDQSDSGKHLYPSEPRKYRCESHHDTLEWGYCQWNYTHGASRKLFNPPACSHLDMCPRGYKGVANQFCVKFVHPMVWEEGFKEAFQTGEETSILDDPEDFKSVFEYIKQLYNEEIQKIAQNHKQYALVWLPVKRPDWHSPLLYVGPNRHESSFRNYNVTWEKGHPRRGQNCLALSLTHKSLHTLPCHRKIPFVTLIKPFRTEAVIKPSKICKDGWLSSGLHFQHNKCFKMFKETVNSTWMEAKQFCKNKGAELPLPTSGFSYLIYESLQKQTYASFWINVRYDTLKKNMVTPGNVKDFIDWIPGVNYNNSYGAMVENGWALETHTNTKSNIVCEKSIQPKQVKINLHEPESSLSKSVCISIDNTEYFDESRGLTCFVNGQQIDSFQVQDDKCMYNLSINEQGYYWCEGWSWSPFMLIKSNKFLFRMPQIYTFAVRIYDPHNDYDPAHHDSTYTVHNTRLESTNPNSSPASSIRNYLRPKYKNYNVMMKNFFYSDVSGDKGMFIDFHLELKLIRNGSSGRNISEEQIYNETITNYLVPNTTINNFTIIHFRSTVQCPHNMTSDVYTSELLTWPRALAGEVVLPNEPCITSDGNPVTMKCQGNFMDGLYWDNLEGECSGTPSNVTKQLWNMTKSDESPEQLTANLVNLTENGNTLQAVDIHLVSSTFQTLTNRAEFSCLNLDDIVQTVNNVMGAEPNRIESVQKRLNSSSSLLASFETLTFEVQMPEVNGKEKVNSSKNLLSVDRINLDKDSNIIGYMSSKSTGKDQTSLLTKGIQVDDIDADAALILPETLTYKVFKDPSIKKKKPIMEKEKVKVTFAVYRNNHLFQQDNSTGDNYVINSQIIMATYKDIEINDLTEPVQILFKPIHKGHDVRCVYWDFQGNGGKGNWSEKGCKYYGETKNGHQHCQCNHLTCFAQLINYNDIGDFENHAIVLHVITIIGCLLSIASLLLVFTTFFIFKKWRRSLSNKILVNLSFAVFCTLVIFLAGIDQVWNSILCRGVAVALHYFILASFGWMLAEAVHQYLKFVKVVGTYIPRFIWKASVCAWGLPVVPILALLVYDSELYDSDLEDTKICWMSATGFKYAFLPILALTMGINMIFFMLILHGAMCGRERINSTLPERELLLNQLSMAVCVFILLGFTWIFGLLAIKDARIVFSYLFCIFNTLQGFFIFIFHVARERNANRLWRDFLSVITGDSSSSTPGNSINPHPSLHPMGTVDGVLYGKGGSIMIVPRNSPNGHCRTSLLSTRTNSSLINSRASFLP